MTALMSPRRWLTPLHVALLTTTTLIVAAVWSVSQHAAPVESRPALSDRAFSEAVSALSEPDLPFQPSGGYDSDNWVSNERSVQQALPQLRRRPGGAYVGVGPEQNFTYLIRSVFHSVGETGGKTNYVTATATFPLASLWQ